MNVADCCCVTTTWWWGIAGRPLRKLTFCSTSRAAFVFGTEGLVNVVGFLPPVIGLLVAHVWSKQNGLFDKGSQ